MQWQSASVQLSLTLGWYAPSPTYSPRVQDWTSWAAAARSGSQRPHEPQSWDDHPLSIDQAR